MPAECEEHFVLPPKPEKLELIEIAHELTEFRPSPTLELAGGTARTAFTRPKSVGTR